MQHKPKISKTERLEIKILRERGYGIREIARVLDRSPSSISGELQRNQVKGAYDPQKAEHKAHNRLRYRRLQWRKIDHDEVLQAYIIQGLKRRWNPDEIAGRMRRDKTPFYASKTAIYAWLRTARGERYCRYLRTQRRYMKKRRPKTERVMIPNRVSIHQRPRGATNRTRYGHWEGDTMVSGKRTKSTAAFSVISERKTKYLDARLIPNLKPSTHAGAVEDMLQDKKALSLTQDNGIENRDHETLRVRSYFTDPYSSWQKGGVENALILFRRDFPKGMDLSLVSPEELVHALMLINTKPRRCLGFASAQEMAEEHGILKRRTNSDD